MYFEILFDFFRYIFAALIAINFYFIIFYIEYFITEVYIIIPFVSRSTNSLIIALFILLISIFFKKTLKMTKFSFSLIIAFFVVNLIFYNNLYIKKEEKRYFPKIISVSPTSFIQEEEIIIKGVNFGATFKKGKITVNKDNLIIKEWTDDKIIAEASVPSFFGQTFLYVVTKEELISKGYSVFRENPDILGIQQQK